MEAFLSTLHPSPGHHSTRRRESGRQRNGGRQDRKKAPERFISSYPAGFEKNYPDEAEIDTLAVFISPATGKEAKEIDRTIRALPQYKGRFLVTTFSQHYREFFSKVLELMRRRDA